MCNVSYLQYIRVNKTEEMSRMNQKMNAIANELIESNRACQTNLK